MVLIKVILPSLVVSVFIRILAPNTTGPFNLTLPAVMSRFVMRLPFKVIEVEAVMSIPPDNVVIDCNKTRGKLELTLQQIPVDLLYIHQLQNLYHALTGEEL